MKYGLNILLLILTVSAVPCIARQTPVNSDVVVDIQTVPLETLRLSDFDPIHPERSPVIFTVTVFNDNKLRDLSIEVTAQSDQYGTLATASKRLGVVAPNAVVSLTNREFEKYKIPDTGNDLVQVGLERGVLPAGIYDFVVRVRDHSIRPRGTLITEGEGTVETTNPSQQFDLLGPGTPFGQEPDVLTNAFPVFQWVSDASRFDFALYRVRPDQRAPEDVTNSRPIFVAEDLSNSTFPYPNFAEALEPGVVYAWQVKAISMTSGGDERQPSEVYWFVAGGAVTASAEQTDSGAVVPPFAGGIASRVEVVPQEITLEPGGTFLFHMTAFDANEVPLLAAAPKWSVQPTTAGIIDESGLFTAAGREGVAAIRARIGDVEDYATAFVAYPAIELEVPVDSAGTDTTAIVAAADSTSGDSLKVGLNMVYPVDEQQILEPSLTFLWQVAGVDSAAATRFRVSIWPTSPTQPADEVPDVPPLLRQTVRKVTALRYPTAAPQLDPGRRYVVRVDVVDAKGNLQAQSLPVAFVIAPQDKVGWDLRQFWDDAIRQGQTESTVTLIAELRTPSLNPLDRLSMRNTGAQIALEDGPWVQLSSPVSSIASLVQLPFLRVLTLPAPPLYSGTADNVPDSAIAAESVTEQPGIHVPVAVFEFGFNMKEVGPLLKEKGLPFHTYAFRRDLNIVGTSPRAAEHGVVTLRAMLDYLPPEAELHLFNFETEIEFRAALRYAVDSLGVKVGSSSVSWMDSYDDYDGTGYLFGDTFGKILGDKAVLVVAAGNFARSHWEGTFKDSDNDNAHDFETGKNFLELQLDSREAYHFLLSWDDWRDSAVDLDLELSDASGQPLFDQTGHPVKSANRQGPQLFEKPVERIRSFEPPYPGTHAYHLRISANRLKPGAPAPHFELYMYPWPEGSSPVADPRSSLASGPAVARAAAVVPVGATRFEHSSQGPTNDRRIRPDFAADGVVQVGEVPVLWPQGTSFAAPRVAAAFTMVWARHPEWTSKRVTNFLRQYTVGSDQGTRKNNQFGWGPIDFDALRVALR